MEKVNVLYSGEGFQTQDLNPADRQLVVSNFINSAFGEPNDYLELYIYSETDNLLEVDYDAFDYYPYLTANPKNNTYSNLVLDPEKDLKNRGYNRGNLKIQYNFYKRLFNSSQVQKYWIKEISTSRTEIRLASQVINNNAILEGFSEYQVLADSRNYFPLFYLNFGNNQTVIATNVAYTEDDQGSYLIIKLYEPLPSDFDLKTQLWIVDKVAESVLFNVSIETEAEVTQELNRLRGPNYNVLLNTKNGQTTPYYTYNSLLMSPISSSFQKLMSYYQDKAMQINVDYSNFSNFVHFSSAVERVNNFVYKLQLIESSSAIIAQQKSIIGGGSVASSSVTVEQKAIDNIIKNFDVYEYFLYFESSSWAFPKSNSTQPYSLYSLTSSQAANFIGGINMVPTANTASILFSASYYDATNKDILRNSVPQYLLDDPSNQPYITFVDMIGQHFDNIWIYYKDVTNRYNATNNPNTGISLDMVSDALQGLGFQLFTNSNVSDNLYYTLFGINPDGSLLPPTGSEIITNYVTSSLTTLPAETIQDEIYKRLYHNLPYLLKTKGTLRGVKALIATYGIPESILTPREFGGNFTGSLDGIIDLNSSEYKLTIVTGSGPTGSQDISSSLLSPYTTIQYYQGNRRLNNTNVEVGFSPADVINNNIVTAQGIFSLDQLIGSPALQYSASYTPLVSASNSYFASYTQPNSIWEYIRLIKFYNNSLFKTIKSFVPARANISTGIIVKSHMYERNKYPRHEPNVTFNDYSQSIEILEISADNGGAISGSTAWSSFVVTPLGLASYSSSQNQELYTGEYDGSRIVVTDGLAMEQGDYTSHITGGIEFYNYGALYQNVTGSVRSQNFIDLDYNSNQLVPVNYGAVTYSLNLLTTDAYAAYSNTNNPFAQLQDYNYFLQRSTIPRYAGSETISATYNTYTEGDQSYGKTAAIDKIKVQYAYIVDIYSSSFQMPYRAQGQIKYLIDNNENVLNLSKNNTNWFSVQNIFKAGEYVDVSLFDYDPANPYINRLNNSDNDFTIWESGYSYTPLIYNPSGSLTYNLEEPILDGGTPADPTTYDTIVAGQNNYWSSFTTRIENPQSTGATIWLQITASSVVGGTSTKDVRMYWYGSLSGGNPGATSTITSIIPAGTTTFRERVSIGQYFFNGNYANWPNGSTSTTVFVLQEQEINQGTPEIPPGYTTVLTEIGTNWLLLDQNTIRLTTTQSAYYNQFIQSGSYSGLDNFAFTFNANPYDIVRFYNVSTSRWDQSGEFRISSVNIIPSESVNFVVLNLDRDVDLVFTNGGSSYPIPISKYVLLKRLEDETSVYFNYNLPQPIPQDGILFPQYIGPGIKENSGNVIKSLKQQNLI